MSPAYQVPAYRGPAALERFPPAVGQSLMVAAWTLATVVVLVAKYGFAVMPNLDTVLRIANDPSNAEHHWALYSSTSAMLAGWLGFTSATSFVIFHQVLVVVVIASLYSWRVIRWSPLASSLVFVLLVGGAMGPNLILWVGSWDPVTVLAASAAILARSQLVRVLAWALFGYNNFFQAGTALAIVVVFWLVNREQWPGWRSVFAAFVGVCAGGLAISLVVLSVGGAESRFRYFLANDMRPLAFVADHAILLGWSAVGVLSCYFMVKSRPARVLMTYLGLLLFALVIASMTARDVSRVTAIVTLPLALVMLRQVCERPTVGIEGVPMGAAAAGSRVSDPAASGPLRQSPAWVWMAVAVVVPTILLWNDPPNWMVDIPGGFVGLFT